MLNLKLAPRAIALAGLLAAAMIQAAPAATTTNPGPAHMLNVTSAGPAHVLEQFQMHKDVAKNLNCGIQWTASIPPNSSQLWFTFGWPSKSYMNWSLMTDSATSDIGAGITDVHTQRTDSSTVTYWITVTNESASTVNFEGRYCYLHL